MAVDALFAEGKHLIANDKTDGPVHRQIHSQGPG
jgi:hypothetical protein